MKKWNVSVAFVVYERHTGIKPNRYSFYAGEDAERMQVAEMFNYEDDEDSRLAREL